MSDIGKEIYERYQQGYERGVADERARCERAVKALFVEDADEGPYLDALRDVYSALFLGEKP